MKNIRTLKLISVIGAISGTIGIICDLTTSSQVLALGGNIVFIPIMVFWYFVYKKVLIKTYSLKFHFFTVTASLLLSGNLMLGKYLDQTMLPGIGTVIIEMFFNFGYIYPIMVFVTDWLDNFQAIEVVEESYIDKFFIFSFLIVVLSWGAGYLAMFPGVYGIDAPTWYRMWDRPDISISSQWSVLISGIFYFFIKLGLYFWNSANIGFGLYTLVQVIFSLLIIWKVLLFVRQEIGRKAMVFTALFYALVPTHIILAVSSSQDAIFSACFAMCCLYLLKIFRNPSVFWKSKKDVISFFLWLCFLCIVRNNGLYAIGIMAVLSIVFLKKYRKQFWMILVSTATVVLIYQGPVYSMFHIQKGTAVREMLSIPLQQMAAIYNYDYSLPDTMKQDMQEYISDENWKTYVWGISDPIKNTFNVNHFKENPLKFLKLYCDVSLQSPKYYFVGTFMQTYGLWYPNKLYTDPNIWHPYLNYVSTDARINWGDDALHITRTSLFPQYEKALGYLFGEGDDTSGYGGNLATGFVNVPILASACRIGTYFCLLFYIALYGLYRGWRNRYLPICFGIGLTITVFLSPLMYYRYYAPVVFSMPLFLAVLFLKDSLDVDQNSRNYMQRRE